MKSVTILTNATLRRMEQTIRLDILHTKAYLENRYVIIENDNSIYKFDKLIKYDDRYKEWLSGYGGRYDIDINLLLALDILTDNDMILLSVSDDGLLSIDTKRYRIILK